MTRHSDPDPGSASDWLLICFNQSGAPTYTQVWVVTGHQYRFSKSDVISRGNWETSDGVEECRLFSQGSCPFPIAS